MANAYIDNTSVISEYLQYYLENPLPKEYVGLIAGYKGIHLSVGIKRSKYDSFTKDIKLIANRVEKDIKESMKITFKPVASKEKEIENFMNEHDEMVRNAGMTSHIMNTLDKMVSEFKEDETGMVPTRPAWIHKWFTFITLARRYGVIGQDLNNGWAQQNGSTITIKVDGEQVVISAPSNTDEIDTLVKGIMNKYQYCIE